MQNDNMFHDMDLMMRSMLDDAGVKAPRRVRKAVFARLAAESQQKAGAVWIRPALCAMACAAAVAAGLFFAGTFRSGTAGTAPAIALVEPQTPPPAGDPEIPATFGTASAYLAYADADVTDAFAGSPEIPVTEEYVTETAAEVPAEDAKALPGGSGTDRQSPSGAASGKRNEDKNKAAIESARTFAAMRLEDDMAAARRAGRIAAFAKGAISGNEPDIRFTRGTPSLAPSAGKTTGISELSESVYGIPFSLGIGVRAYIFPRLSVGIGADYSLLTRTFTGKYTKVENDVLVKSETGSVQHNLQYIGIPVNLYYDILGTDKLKFYTYAGVETEFALSNRYTLFSNPDIIHSAKVEKPQYSVGLGFGLEFALSKILGLYADPGVRYYFPCDQPKSVRTDKPLLVSFDAGLRFNF